MFEASFPIPGFAVINKRLLPQDKAGVARVIPGEPNKLLVPVEVAQIVWRQQMGNYPNDEKGTK